MLLRQVGGSRTHTVVSYLLLIIHLVFFAREKESRCQLSSETLLRCLFDHESCEALQGLDLYSLVHHRNCGCDDDTGGDLVVFVELHDFFEW